MTTRRGHLGAAPALTWAGICNAFSLDIKASSKVRAFVGEKVLLSCTFKSISPITESLTVDWTYRPLTGGHMETIFHYQSVAYPTTVGKFKDRISWVGNVAKGDASIAIQSPVMSDNGTFICSVKNPPDVYHNIPQTVLIVTERGFSFQLTSAVLLSILVFLPSIVVVILMLVRLGRKSGLLKEKKKSGCKKSSIEVSDESEHTDTCSGRLKAWCLNCVQLQSSSIGNKSFERRRKQKMLYSKGRVAKGGGKAVASDVLGSREVPLLCCEWRDWEKDTDEEEPY
ncbi:myelin protein zero-like protein 3 isoform X2 [Cygnus olor]|uniref:myelin protein zero-like protein 3 isoform X2 n=1 Tax=Cygnus olor TaxID=8869 RepID=UPI001ADE49E4|nr:myelin protein zero-like protein 3 isoform X2 [Cygnus olor]